MSEGGAEEEYFFYHVVVKVSATRVYDLGLGFSTKTGGRDEMVADGLRAELNPL